MRTGESGGKGSVCGGIARLVQQQLQHEGGCRCHWSCSHDHQLVSACINQGSCTCITPILSVFRNPIVCPLGSSTTLKLGWGSGRLVMATKQTSPIFNTFAGGNVCFQADPGVQTLLASESRSMKDLLPPALYAYILCFVYQA